MFAKNILIGILMVGGVAAQTPAEVAIEQAQRFASERASVQSYSRLALGYARRARETADGAYYEKGHEALDKALALQPDAYEARRIRPWLLLGQHEFAAALDAAKELNKEYPDDVMVWGMLTDAHVELGNYDEAVESAQWMLNMRPGNVPGLTRAAYLRELHGQEDGAVELFRTALERVRHTETEERAWILCQMAHVERQRGNAEKALDLAEQALEEFPGYHYGLAERGRTLLALGRAEEAVEDLRARYEAAPHPENLFDVGLALLAAGRESEAHGAFAEFEIAGLEESANNDNANGQMVSLYVDHLDKPADALRLAELEFSRRKDVFTRTALAWALHHNEQTEEAWAHMEVVLQLGVRSAEISYRAGVIALGAGKVEAADELLAEAMRRSPGPEVRRGVGALRGEQAEASE